MDRSNYPMNFEVRALRFLFEAVDPVRLDPGSAGNVFRGAFGAALKRLACEPECTSARSCRRAIDCAYARLFEPSATVDLPSGLLEPPRPFVIRALHLDGRAFGHAAAIPVDVHLFTTQNGVLPIIIQTLEELGRRGVGSARSRLELRQVATLNADSESSGTLFRDGRFLNDPAAPITLDLAAVPVATASRVILRFVTPTELKGEDAAVRNLDFCAVFARLRDRVSTLRQLYGAGPLNIDFKAMGERASAVRTVSRRTRLENFSRRSGRTGLVHGIGGFTGEVEYEGDLTDFIPWLRAAYWTGVGRHTVWGNGEVRVAVAQ